MIIFFDRMTFLQSGSVLFSESPLDNNTHGRLNGAWFDTHGVQSLQPADVKLNFNATEWRGLTGNFVGNTVLGSALSNAPFNVQAAEEYTYLVEAISGPGGAKQSAVAKASSGWQGERFFMRASDAPEDITSVAWKEVDTFFVETGRVTTTDTTFTTLITHPVETDTLESIRFFANGIESSGTGRGFFEVVLTVQNIAGTVSVVGETIVIEHKTLGVINVQGVPSGSDLLIQVRGPLATFDWTGETHFNEGIS